MTILDLAPVFPPERSRPAYGDSQLEREIRSRLQAAGWPPSQIVEQYRSRETSDRLTPDFALLDPSGTLVAIVEVKGFQRLLGEPLSQAISLAKVLKARFALVTNAQQVLVYDSRSDMTLSRQNLPCPEEIGLEVEPLDVKEFGEEGPVSVVPLPTGTSWSAPLNTI